MIKLELTFPTVDDALAAITKLAGINVSSVSAEAVAKKPTPAQKAAKATVEEFEDEAPKAKPAKGKKSKVPTVEELKAAILEAAGDSPDAATKVRDYVNSFGSKNISSMTDDQRVKALAGIEEYFAAEEEEEADPMD